MILDKVYGKQFIILEKCSIGVTYEELNSWNDEAKKLIVSFESLLSSLSDIFWSTVVHSPNFQQAFSAALNSLPTVLDQELFHAFYEWEEHISRTACHLRTILLGLYLRIANYNEIMDSDLGQKQWLEIIRQENVMSFALETSVWAHFPSNTNLFVKIVNYRSKLSEWHKKEIPAFTSSLGEMNGRLGEYVDVLLKGFKRNHNYKKYQYAKLIDEYLITVLNHIYVTHITFQVLEKSSLTLTRIVDFVAGLPELVEIISSTLQIEDIFDISMNLPFNPQKRLLRLMSMIEYEAVSLFKTLLSNLKTTESRFKLISDAAINERFIFVLHKKYDIINFLQDCPDKVHQYQNLVEGISLVQIEKTFQKLAKLGLLKNLGNFEALNQSQKNSVQEILDIFPDLTPAFVHLLLRHFNFSSTEAIEALVQKEAFLPLDLLTVENADLQRPDGNTQQILPCLSFSDHDAVANAIPCPERSVVDAPNHASSSTNMFKGLFSLAPPKKEDVVKSPPDLFDNIEQAMEQLRRSLNRLKTSIPEEVPNESSNKTQEGLHGEVLIPMASSKKHGITKFKVTEKDRIATRPTYESYKMESVFEDDLYNDEYDDGYEAREFQVEPLNEDLPKSDGDEDDEDNDDRAPAVSNSDNGVRRGGNPTRGYRGRGRGAPAATPDGAPVSSRPSNYTGGRERQMKEKHKNDMKKRGADRKRRGGMF